jgi:hypothetical protein
MQLFKQIAIPGKGQGLVATKDIEKGTRILSELPIVSLPGKPHPNVILKAFESLEPPARQAFSQLHCHVPPPLYGTLAQMAGKPVAAINPKTLIILGTYLNNHLDGHIFLHGSRINHSCTPNLDYAWNPNLKQATFHSIKHIKKGKKLTIFYIPGNHWTKARRDHELQRWGFACSCLPARIPRTQRSMTKSAPNA